jgi:PAS domain S-box-containing protein
MEGQQLTITLTEQTLKRLTAYCRQAHCTPDAMIQACLQRLTGDGLSQPDSASGSGEQAELSGPFKAQIDQLQQELAELRQEKADLEIMLEMTSVHSDAVASDLKTDAEVARRETEEQFRLISEATPVGILITRMTDGQILYANATAGKILQLPVQALTQRPATDFYDDRADRPKILAAVEQHRSFQGELKGVRANGTSFWALLSLQPFTFKREATLLVALIDITERKQAEEALRLAEEKYHSIFENALEGIYQSSPEGRYLNVNPAMASLHGYSSPDEMLMQVTEISHQIYVDPTRRDRFKAAIDQQGQVTDFEYQIYRRDGTLAWVCENARAVRDINGKLLHYEGIIQDITERKQIEESLKRQVEELRVEIDHSKRAREVAEITQSDYFKTLQSEVDRLNFEDDF